MASSFATAAVYILLQISRKFCLQQCIHICSAMPFLWRMKYLLLPGKACVQQSPVVLAAADFLVPLLVCKQSQRQLLATWHLAQGQEQR